MLNEKEKPHNLVHVFVADDHALFRDGMQALISAQEDMAWAGDAADGASAVSQITTCRPDVVLMDINMPYMNGLQATRKILSDQSDTRIIMVTMVEDDASVFAAMKAGARGYVLKGSNADEMLTVIRAVASGQILFGAKMADRMLAFFQHPQRDQTTPFPDLTDRERELLDSMARGLNNNEIAEELVISPKTVRNHITKIFDKLQVADRSHAIVKARKAGLGH